MAPSKNAFDELVELIETAAHPFPVAQARRLVLRATGRTPATDELARMIDRFGMAIQSLAEVLEEYPEGQPYYCRQDALDDVSIMRGICDRHKHKATPFVVSR